MSSNFKPYLLSLSLLIGVAGSRASTAKALISNICSKSVEERVAQLERVSNAYSQLLIQLQQQIADNQCDIDSLRGQMQENQYNLTQILDRQKQIYQKIDRLSSQSPADDTVIAAGNNDNANTDYNEAVRLVLEKKHYNQAMSAFRSFIKNYPDSTYQLNANYWLGQLNYHQGKKDDALYYFALVAKTYPKSLKAPDALLKVGVIMQEKGHKDKARAVFQQVGKLYPHVEAAKQAQKRLASL